MEKKKEHNNKVVSLGFSPLEFFCVLSPSSTKLGICDLIERHRGIIWSLCNVIPTPCVQHFYKENDLVQARSCNVFLSPGKNKIKQNTTSSHQHSITSHKIKINKSKHNYIK